MIMVLVQDDSGGYDVGEYTVALCQSFAHITPVKLGIALCQRRESTFRVGHGVWSSRPTVIATGGEFAARGCSETVSSVARI